MILYEYPFNERIRTYLRLERLFINLTKLIGRTEPIDHHFALLTIFEIMDVGARADLKSDVLKDIEKQKNLLNSYRGNPAIAESLLNQICHQLDHCFSAMNSVPGRTGQSLIENEWLMSIRSRIGIPGGTCEFDLPAYFAWQHKATEERQSDLNRWTSSLKPLARAIELLLRLLRESGVTQKIMATGGQFQQNLPQGRIFQLLRLEINPKLNLIPEISGNRLMVSVRFMHHDEDGRIHASKISSAFELTLCA